MKIYIYIFYLVIHFLCYIAKPLLSGFYYCKCATMYNMSIVFFKRLGNRGFHNPFNQYVFSFNKRYEYCKTGAYGICANFPDFLATFSW